MSGASSACEEELIGAAKSPSKANTDGPGTDSTEECFPRRRRQCPPPTTIVHRHIHQHNVNLRITGCPPPCCPVIVNLPPFTTTHVETVPGMGIPAAETECQDGATSDVRRPGERRRRCPTLTRNEHVHEHNVIMNILEAPPCCPRILVHLPETPAPVDDDDDDFTTGDEGAAYVEEPVYTTGLLDKRKKELVPGDIILVDMSTSLNYPGGIYIGGNYVLGRDDNTMRIVQRHLGSFNEFYKLRYKRSSCRCYPADEVVRRAKAWEGLVYRGENRFSFPLLCLTGLTIDEIHETDFLLRF